MTAQDLGNLRVAELVRQGADLPEYLKLLRDVQRAGECGEAESMAVETQDAADADQRGVLEVRREWPVLFEQEVEFPLQAPEEPPPAFDSLAEQEFTAMAVVESVQEAVPDPPPDLIGFKFTTLEGPDVDLPCFDPNRAASTSSLAAGEGPDVTQPAPPEGTPDYPGDPWQAPSRDQWIGALGAILAGITVVFAVIGFCDVLRMMFGK